MIERKSRAIVNDTTWKDNNRTNFSVKSRDYLLWSFFSSIKTIITDPKDWYALKIQCDPAYIVNSIWKAREESN
jgi:hypothetical protein